LKKDTTVLTGKSALKFTYVCVFIVTQKDLRGRVGMESNWQGNGWGWIQMSAGTGGDGFKVRGDWWGWD